MSVTETGNALAKLRKVIQSLQKEEMMHIQKTSGDALKQIVMIARENNLSAEHIKFAMSARQPRAERAIRGSKKFRKNRGDVLEQTSQTDSVVQ